MALDNLRREQAGLATAKLSKKPVPREMSVDVVDDGPEMTAEEKEVAIKASLAQIAAEQGESGVDDGAPPLV